MKGYDILGNIAIVKFDSKETKKEKIKQAYSILKKHSNISTILEKTGKFKGRLRIQKTKYLLGVKTKEVLYKENGCIFHFNIEECYFSPRLSSERLDIANQIKNGENVLVMFGGVAPFAIVISKTAKPNKVISIELGRKCNFYAKENIKRNKVQDIVELIQGDVRKKVPILKEKFDRIIMSRPNLKDSFLDIAFPKIKNKGIINYYGFCKETELENLKSQILQESKKAGKKIKIINIKKAGDIGVRAFRYRIDILFL